MKNITIKEIQEWEKSFSIKKSIPQNEEESFKIGICKLIEEVGEVSKALIENKWYDIQAEISDVIIFACKLANAVEKFHNQKDLSSVIIKKISNCEKGKYDSKNKKLIKPKL